MEKIRIFHQENTLDFLGTWIPSKIICGTFLISSLYSGTALQSSLSKGRNPQCGAQRLRLQGRGSENLPAAVRHLSRPQRF